METELREKEYKNILEGLKLLSYKTGMKLKKQKQYDFLICREVWVHKLVYGDTILFLNEEEFKLLKALGFECITID